MLLDREAFQHHHEEQAFKEDLDCTCLSYSHYKWFTSLNRISKVVQ